MKNTDIEILKKRREKMLERRSQSSEEQPDFGLGYAYIVDGQIYPVCAMFQMGDGESPKEKIHYLIKGGKE